MADFAEALKVRLVDILGVGAEVHWVKIPQGKLLPYTRLQVISDPRPQHLGGYDGARVTRIQADFFANSWGKARAMAKAALEGLAAPVEIDGVRFGRTSVLGPRDYGEDAASGFIHRASMDLLVEHTLA